MKYLPSLQIQAELVRHGLEQFCSGIELDDQELSQLVAEYSVHPAHEKESEAEILDRAAYFLIWRDYGVPQTGKAAEDVTAKRITVMHETLREMAREHFPKMAEDFAAVKESASIQAGAATAMGAQFSNFTSEHVLAILRLRGDIRSLHNVIVSGQVESLTAAQNETDRVCEVIRNLGKMLFWGLLAIVSILAALTFFAARAHAQIDVIQFQDNAGANVATYAAPFKFKAGSNCSASKSGSTVTFNCAGGAAAAGGSNTQVQYNNATALGGITNLTSDGTNVTKLTAGAGPFDFLNATIVKLRASAGLTTSTNGDCGYDTTNNRWHCWQGGADRLMIASTNVGAAGQVPTSNADGSSTFVDPIVSLNYVNLWTAQDVTATRTSAAVRVSNFGAFGALFVTWASITGAPSGCTVQVKSGDSAGNFVNNGSAISVSPANGSSVTLFQPAATIPTNSQLQALFACSVYPTTGTLTLELAPAISINSNLATLAGTAVDVNSGNKSAGTQRVVLATDQPALTNKLLVTPDSVALPANQSVNVSQLAGTTTDTNSGAKSAGTLRVVLATDQPALTNKLLVTPDSVALPANQSVNVSQINGVTPLMGNGGTGTGSHRVTIASDNTAFTVNAAQSGTWTVQPGNTANTTPWLTTDSATSATGSAVPAKAGYIGGAGSGSTGGNLIGIPVGDTYKNINISTATTTLLVTGVASRQVRISALHMITAAANNVALIEGTGATCGTGTAGMAGGTTAASGYNLAANGGIAFGSGLGTVMQTATAGDSVCIVTSATTQLSGGLQYTIY